jgi:glutathione S-transferase
MRAQFIVSLVRWLQGASLGKKDNAMTYDLVIGDRGYSSWSLRGWLLFDAFGIPVRTISARLYTDELPTVLRDFFPARTAPTMRTPDGSVVPRPSRLPRNWPPATPRPGFGPRTPRPRHRPGSGSRDACGLHRAPLLLPDEPARQLHRLPAARGRPGRPPPPGNALVLGARRPRRSTTPWLCGAYSAADAFFAPVATRIATYNLPVNAEAMVYVNAHLAHPSFRRWRAMGLVDGADQDFYRRDYPRRDWPGPVPLPAKAVTAPTR